MECQNSEQGDTHGLHQSSSAVVMNETFLKSDQTQASVNESEKIVGK